MTDSTAAVSEPAAPMGDTAPVAAAPADFDSHVAQLGEQWEKNQGNKTVAELDAAKNAPAPLADENKPAAAPESKPATAPVAADPNLWTPDRIQAAQAQIEQQSAYMQKWYNEQAQPYIQQIQQRDQQLQAIVNDPAFKAAYEQITRGQQAPTGQPGANAPANSPAAAAKPWASITPETETEKALIGSLDWQHQQYESLRKENAEMRQQFEAKFGDIPKQFDARLAPLEQDRQISSANAANAEVETAIKTVGDRFPDLVGDKDKENALCNEALDFLYGDWAKRDSAARSGRSMAGEPLTISQAIEKAARLLGSDGAEKRAFAKVQGTAKQSAAARTEAPGRAAATPQPNYEEIVAADAERAFARQ